MTLLTEEIPFTNEALKIYISETEKEMNKIHEIILKYGRLKTRLKKSRKRLKDHGG